MGRHTSSLSCTIYLFILVSLFHACAGIVVSDCDTANEWSLRGGVPISTTTKLEGTGALQWNTSIGSLSLRSLNASTPMDLTAGGGNTLNFWCYLATAQPEGSILLQINSENPGTSDMDYYSYQFSLNFTGWKLISRNFNAFVVNRSPLGWNKTTAFQFNAVGWGMTPDPLTVLFIDNITTSYTSPYCAMSDTDLFESLDYAAFPALSTVRSRFNSNDLNGARSAFANYIRTRAVKYSFDPLRPNKSQVAAPTRAANQSTTGTVTVVNIPYTFRGGAIDWSFNPTISSPPFDPEWQWQLNRMGWWWDLGRAWWYSGSDIYAETFVNQLMSFYRTQTRPCANRNTAQPSSWRTIECGIRTSGSFIDAFLRFVTAPQMTDDVIISFVKLIGDHAHHLMEYNTGGNWLTMEMNGLYTLAGVFPEFSEAKNWRLYAAQRLYADMAVQLLPDGAQYELSTGYHQVFLDNVIGLYDAARMFGTLNELPSDYLKALEKAYEYNAKIVQPNWFLPFLNDAWSVGVRQRCIDSLDYFPNNALLKFCARQTGAPTPSFTSIFLPNSGHAVMRSSWASDATYALMDVGPIGYAHEHQDKLNLVFSAYGRPLLWDGGGGMYEQSKWRTYALSTYNHNTAIIDDLAQRLTRVNRDTDPLGAGNPNTPSPVWQTTDNFDYTQGTYMDGYGTGTNMIATHHREVFFLKSFDTPAFIVVDRFLPNNNASHKYTVIWNFLTTNTTLESNKKVFFSKDSRVGNVALVPLSSVSATNVTSHVAEDGNMLWGWYVSRDSPRYIPATTILHQRTSAGVVYMASLMIALSPNATFSSANVSDVTSTGNSYSVSVNGAAINFQLSDDEVVGGMIVTAGGATYTTSNYGSSTTGTTSATTGTTGATSSPTGSTSSGTSSPSSSGTTGNGQSDASVMQVSHVLSISLVLIAVAVLW